MTEGKAFRLACLTLWVSASLSCTPSKLGTAISETRSATLSSMRFRVCPEGLVANPAIPSEQIAKQLLVELPRTFEDGYGYYGRANCSRMFRNESITIEIFEDQGDPNRSIVYVSSGEVVDKKPPQAFNPRWENVPLGSGRAIDAGLRGKLPTVLAQSKGGSPQVEPPFDPDFDRFLADPRDRDRFLAIVDINSGPFGYMMLCYTRSGEQFLLSDIGRDTLTGDGATITDVTYQSPRHVLIEMSNGTCHLVSLPKSDTEH